MIPHQFPEANTRFGAPSDLTEQQVTPICGYFGRVKQGSLEGAKIIVTAWQPTEEEKAKIAAGEPIFLSFLSNGLPPHYPSMSFQEATNPA